MKLFQKLVVAMMLAAGLTAAWAQEADTDALKSKLQTLFGGREVAGLEPAPMPGLYEAVVGGEVVYVTADGSFMLHGNLYDIRNGLENLTENRISGLRKDAIAGLSEDQMVSFGPKDAEDTITVFTDIDCGYCRKLHGEMDKYNEKGIRVRYLFFPRSGPGGESFRKAVSVWCADDRQAAMTAAKKGEAIEQKECENPVLDHYKLGRELGVTGTPAIVLDSGEMLPGYIPADRLKPALEELRKKG